MVRVPAAEGRVYDREKILGRDTASVFPNESRRAEDEARRAAAGAVGGLRFVSEGELKEEMEGRGSAAAGPGDGRPLSEVLRIAREKKEEEFQEKWRIMKEGGNRPLDEDEVAFYDECEALEEERRRRRQREQEEDMLAYRLCMAERERAVAGELEAGPGAGPATAMAEEAGRIAASAAAGGTSAPAAGKRAREAVVVRVRRKKPATTSAAADPGAGAERPTGDAGAAGAEAEDVGGPAAEDLPAADADDADDSNALRALLSSYNSDSDDG